MRSHTPIFLLGFAVGALAVWLSLRGIEIEAVSQVLLNGSWHPGLVGIGGMLAFLVVKALRWRVLLRPFARIEFKPLMSAVAVGSAANYAVPHIGEIYRIWALRRATPVSRSAVAATIAVERVLDVAAVCLLGIGLLTVATSTVEIDRALRFMAVASAACFVFIMVLIRFPEAIISPIGRVLAIVSPKLGLAFTSRAELALAGFSSLREPGYMVMLTLLSVLQWLCIIVCILTSMAVAGLVASVAANAAVLVLLVAGLVLPSAPGYLGTTQLAFVLALKPLGYAHADAFSASIVYTVLTVATVLVAAAFAYSRLPPGESPGDLDLNAPA